MPCSGGPRIFSRRTGSLAIAAALLLPIAAALAAPQPPPFVPQVAAGFALAPLTPLPVATSIAFGPGDGDGEDLYATTLLGDVVRIPLTWTPAGPVAGPFETVATGFSSPLGLVFDGDVLYVADSTSSAETSRTDGRVTRVEDGEKRVLVGGLPNGRHNTNNLRIGPDGLLYIANGNPNDDGVSGGDADVLPYSGAILAVDADALADDPAVLRWRDASGALIPPASIATHPVNADFASKVTVVGYGFRNVYDVAFGPTGAVYTATNGADATPSQDQFYRIGAPGDFHGFPFCFSEGTPGGTAMTIVNSPQYPSFDCSTTVAAQANLGWHVCATGLDVAPAGTFFDSAFVAECGPLQQNVATASVNDPTHATYNTGHKVARVALDDNGNAVGVFDFIVGLHLPTDVLFGPDGALYVADADAIYRVVQLVEAPLAAAPAALPGSPILAQPGAWIANYATPAAAVPVGGEITFTNADLFKHDVVSHAFGEDDQPWCAGREPGRCPLFWTPLVGTGGSAPVQGLDRLQPTQTYTFYCTLHGPMEGTLVALPAP